MAKFKPHFEKAHPAHNASVLEVVADYQYGVDAAAALQLELPEALVNMMPGSSAVVRRMPYPVGKYRAQDPYVIPHTDGTSGIEFEYYSSDIQVLFNREYCLQIEKFVLSSASGSMPAYSSAKVVVEHDSADGPKQFVGHMYTPNNNSAVLSQPVRYVFDAGSGPASLLSLIHI